MMKRGAGEVICFPCDLPVLHHSILPNPLDSLDAAFPGLEICIPEHLKSFVDVGLEGGETWTRRLPV